MNQRTARRSDCRPIICGRTLMSNGGEFIDKRYLNYKCGCTKKAICFQLVQLLSDNKQKEADDLLTKLYDV